MEPINISMEPINISMEPINISMEPINISMESINISMEPINIANLHVIWCMCICGVMSLLKHVLCSKLKYFNVLNQTWVYIFLNCNFAFY